MHKPTLSKIFFISMTLILSACSSSPRFTSSKTKHKKHDETKATVESVNPGSYNNSPVLKTVIGVASFYADKFHGRLTSNGEIYNMYGLTAAHPTYLHNTIIRVTNLSNNKSVIIRINDRMPLHSDRIIDLSYGTALELDMVEAGVVEVKLEILEWGKD